MKTASAKELDRMFDAGEDMTEYINWDATVRINQSSNHDKDDFKLISVEFPTWAVKGLNEQATLMSIDTNSLIRRWVLDRLKQEG